MAPAARAAGSFAIDLLFILCLFAIPAAVGGLLPTRIATWLLVPLALAVVAAFRLEVGLRHGPWPYFLAPAAVGYLFGMALRRSVGAIRRARR